MLKAIIFILSIMYISTAMAAGDAVIYNFKPPILVNGKLASKHTPISFGDEILTGDKAQIVLKLDGSVYRMGSRTRLKLPETTEKFSLNIFFGSVLAVFKRNTPKTIYTNTAVLGVRGTGLFLHVDNQQTYLCTCYGDIDFADVNQPKQAVHIHGEYHQVVALNHQTHRFSKPAMVGHVSQDLFDLEALADRTPPTTFAADFHANNKVVQ